MQLVLPAVVGLSVSSLVLVVLLFASVRHGRDLQFRLQQERDARQKVRCLLKRAVRGVELFDDQLKSIRGMHDRFVVLHERQSEIMLELLRSGEGERCEES